MGREKKLYLVIRRFKSINGAGTINTERTDRFYREKGGRWNTLYCCPEGEKVPIYDKGRSVRSAVQCCQHLHAHQSVER